MRLFDNLKKSIIIRFHWVSLIILFLRLSNRLSCRNFFYQKFQNCRNLINVLHVFVANNATKNACKCVANFVYVCSLSILSIKRMPIFSTCSKHVRYFSISAFNKAHKQGKYIVEKIMYICWNIFQSGFYKESTLSGQTRCYISMKRTMNSKNSFPHIRSFYLYKKWLILRNYFIKKWQDSLYNNLGKFEIDISLNISSILLKGLLKRILTLFIGKFCLATDSK